MLIGLIDVDGHAKKKKWGATIYPNLALCKIAGWHRYVGDVVEWYSPLSPDTYDIVYMSKIFNFSPDYGYSMPNVKRIVKGGTGYMGLSNSPKTEYWHELPSRMDKAKPDYSIYPHIPIDTAYGFLTRGCPNICLCTTISRSRQPSQTNTTMAERYGCMGKQKGAFCSPLL